MKVARMRPIAPALLIAAGIGLSAWSDAGAQTAEPQTATDGSAQETTTQPEQRSLPSALGNSTVSVFRQSVSAASDSAATVGNHATTALSSAGTFVTQTIVVPVINGIDAVTDWPVDTLRRFITRLHAGEFQHFSELVNSSGFAIGSVDVGVGLIPSVGITFTHERNLSDAQYDELQAKVDSYHSDYGMVTAYIETTILQALVLAGRQSEITHLHEAHVELFPLPGLELSFDPLEFSRHSHEVKSQSVAIGSRNLKKLEERLLELERRVLGLPSDTQTQ